MGITLDWVLILVISFFFAVHYPAFQTWMAQQAAGYLSKEWDTKVEIERVEIRFINDVLIEGVYIQDLRGDTLVYAPQIYASVADFSVSENYLELGEVSLVDARIGIAIPEGEEDMNFQFIVDYFESEEEDTTETEFDLRINSINLTNANFSYLDENDTSSTTGMNFSDLHFHPLDMTFSEFGMSGDTIHVNFDHFSATERVSGFQLNEFAGNLEFGPHGIYMKDFLLETEESHVSTPLLSFKTDSLADFGSFVDKVKMNIAFDEGSRLQLSDLAYFVPDINGIDHVLGLGGEVKGKVSNLKAKNLLLQWSDLTYIRTNADISGLPEVSETFMAVAIDSLQTNKAELEAIDLPPFDGTQSLDLPGNLSRLGMIAFSGSFMGFYNDFVAFGDLRTDVGRLKTDVKVLLDEENDNMAYKGKLDLQRFRLGYLYDLKGVGDITASINIDTAYGYDLENLHAVMGGTIHSVGLNDYDYKKIDLNGVLESDQFNGDIAMADENIDFEFHGGVDFSGALPQYNFNARLNQARLAELNLSNRDPLSALCLDLEIDAIGNDPDNFKGMVAARNISYYEHGKEMAVDSVRFETFEDDLGTRITVVSDLAYAEIGGQYDFATLETSMKLMASNVVPALIDRSEIDASEVEDNFNVTLEFYEAAPVTNMFMPEIYVAPYTRFEASYNSIWDELTMDLRSDSIVYDSIPFRKLVAEGYKMDDIFFLDLKMDKLEVNDSLYFDDLKVSLIPWQDQISTGVSWHNSDRENGNIKFDALIYDQNTFGLQLKKSNIVVHGKKWESGDQGMIKLDSSAINIDSIYFAHGEQLIAIKGDLTQNPEDRARVDLRKFSLTNANAFLLSTGLTFTGKVDGHASVGDVYNSPYFTSNLNIDSLVINENWVGEVRLDNTWDGVEQKVLTSGEVMRESKTPAIAVNGAYHVARSDNELDYTLTIRGANLEFVNAFLPEEEVSDFYAIARGDLRITGAASSPEVKGDFYFDEGRAYVAYLNTRYYFHGGLTLTKDEIVLKNVIPLYDQEVYKRGEKHNATLSGSITHEGFDNMSFNLAMLLNRPFLAMNTNYSQNPLFYGKAYATGFVGVSGYQDQIEIYADVKSEKNTAVFLPMYGAEEVSMADYVIFSDTMLTGEEEYEVDLEGITMEFNMEVTPDALIEIQFDPAIGDVMRGRGKGNLNMSIDELGEFRMSGGIEVVDGNYLFTLYNVINKPFEIVGGTIQWTGDPYTADVDLKTLYKVKAPLSDLMGDEERYSDNVEVLTYMNLSGDLFNPEITFDLDVPSATGDVQSTINRIEQDEAELNKQIFSLMVVQRFMPQAGSGGGPNIVDASTDAAGSTTAEMLNAQASRILNTLSDKWDLGINYEPGDQVAGDDVSLLFERDLNEKISISGNVGVAGTGGSHSSVIGDFEVNYEVSDRLKLKGYNESNDFDVTNTSQAQYTQGVGITYEEEFNDLSEVCFIQNILNVFRKKGKRKYPCDPEKAEKQAARDPEDEDSADD